MIVKCIFCLLTVVAFLACSEKNKTYQNTIDLKVPDAVENQKKAGHFQLYGTSFFCPIDSLCSYEVKYNRYTLPDDCELYVHIYPKSVDAIIDTVWKSTILDTINYFKAFNLNKNKAAIFYADNALLKEELLLITGTNSECISIRVQFPANNEGIRKKILNLLLQSYYSTSTTLKPSLIYGYFIDLKRSGYYFDHYSSLSVIYTKNGETELMKNHRANRLMINNYHSVAAELEAYGPGKVSNDCNVTYDTSYTLNDFIVNEAIMHCIETQDYLAITKSNSDPKEYQIYLIGVNGLLIKAILYSQIEEEIEKIRKIIPTIKPFGQN